jgi:hypothetical protein
VAFSFAFLAMLCISNLAPPSPSSFDPLRHFYRRGDVSCSSSSLTIHIRWSKTSYSQSALVSLFLIPNSLLCPLQAFLHLKRFFPVCPSAPLLSYQSGGRLIILTQSHLQRVLRLMVSSLALHPFLTFHSFQRSAASLASSAGQSFQSIQAHGL